MWIIGLVVLSGIVMAGNDFAFADTFEGIVKSEISSKGRTLEAISYFRGSAARVDVNVSGAPWLTSVVDINTQTIAIIDRRKQKISRYTFDDWKATSRKKARKKKGPLYLQVNGSRIS